MGARSRLIFKIEGNIVEKMARRKKKTSDGTPGDKSGDSGHRIAIRSGEGGEGGEGASSFPDTEIFVCVPPSDTSNIESRGLPPFSSTGAV